MRHLRAAPTARRAAGSAFVVALQRRSCEKCNQPTIPRVAPSDFFVFRTMPRASTTCLRLLGPFTVEVNVGRPIAIALRSKKARALLAYLAMKPDWRASREELATLLWGDTPDAQARHSLRQCLMSVRQDLHLAPDLLDLGRDTIELRADALGVDARELAALADAGENERASELWRGPFLADLALDLEAFDAWREREQERLASIAARAFEAQCAAADAAGEGERALAAAERLIALDPT